MASESESRTSLVRDVELASGRIVCRSCRAPIGFLANLLSKAFRGVNGGKAALFSHTSNVTFYEPEIRLMITGAHTIREISCTACGSYLGWQIVRAHEWTEKWKEGKYVIERDFVASDRPLASPTTTSTTTTTTITSKSSITEKIKSDPTAERTARWRADVFIAGMFNAQPPLIATM